MPYKASVKGLKYGFCQKKHHKTAKRKKEACTKKVKMTRTLFTGLTMCWLIRIFATLFAIASLVVLLLAI